MSEPVVSEIFHAYLHALLEGDSLRASEAISRGLSRGHPVKKLYVDVVLASANRLAELQAAGKFSRANEALAAQISLAEMGRLRMMAQTKARLGMRALVVGISKVDFGLSARCLADFLNMEGWEVDFVGGGLSVPEVVQFAGARKPNLVCLTVTSQSELASCRTIGAELRVTLPQTRTVVCADFPENETEMLAELGVDAMGRNPQDLLEEIRRVMGLSASTTVLSQYLRGLGSRIQMLRKTRRLSQQEVANISGLDRAYISSVENGKQNLTIGVVLKLAEALEVTVEDLLVSDRPASSERSTFLTAALVNE